MKDVILTFSALLFVFLALPWVIAGIGWYWNWCGRKIYGDDCDDE